MIEGEWLAVRAGERVVFPSPAALGGPAAPRNLTCCALLRLADGTVAFARTVGTPWTDARLDALDKLLCRVGEDGRRDPDLERSARRALGLPTLSLGNVALDGIDPAAWSVRGAAIAALGRAVRRAPEGWDATRAGAEADALARRFGTTLDRALASFVAGLDPDVCAVAARHARLDTAHYAFLARGTPRSWRLQFAQSFPFLVPAAMAGAAGSGGAVVRAAVDAGVPLVRALAGRWAVSPGVLRCLRGRSVEHVGARWSARAHQLVRILDALRPEDRPGDDAMQWKRLSDAVDAAEQIFRRPAWSSPLTLGWLRDAARRGFARLDEARPGRRLAPEAVPQIDALRQALVRHLVAAASGAGSGDDPELRSAATAVADRRLAALNPARLGAVAHSYALEYAPRRAALEAKLQRTGGWVFWPLLPREIIAAGGTRRVAPLATRADIRSEGIMQQLCIAKGTELEHMVQQCAAGEAYLLSIRDARTGLPRSTAEVRVVRQLGIGAPELRVVQHRARHNAQPSAECEAALREALAWAAGREGRAHLEEGGRAAADGRRAGGSMERDGDNAATAEALRSAFGDDVEVLMVRAARELAAARRAVATLR